FPFGLAFPTLSDSFVSDFLGAFQVSAPAFRLSAFPFPAVPTLSEVLGRIDRRSFSDLSGGALLEKNSRK
ncbi:hypothetical protein ACFWVU_37425, partial [Streptomyces sp. NPDC058686]|uniref:hypothetical protein n=1 Tax=Streptomyces sp. NPDC058686 TaxID=3346599 RepID=UPI0036674EB4